MSQTDRHTHPVRLPCTCDQPVAEAATYTSHNKHSPRRVSNPQSHQSSSRRPTP